MLFYREYPYCCSFLLHTGKCRVIRAFNSSDYFFRSRFLYLSPSIFDQPSSTREAISWLSNFHHSIVSQSLDALLLLYLSLFLSILLSMSITHNLSTHLIPGTSWPCRRWEDSSIRYLVCNGTGHPRHHASWSLRTGEERSRLCEICLLNMFHVGTICQEGLRWIQMGGIRQVQISIVVSLSYCIIYTPYPLSN